MTAEMLAFAGVAVVLLASSLGVVLTPNLFHAVLYLAAALVATGVVFLLLDAPFLFAVQLLLYAGGVVTIVVFAIMLTERLVGASIKQASRYLINGALVSAAVFVGVVGFLAYWRLITFHAQPYDFSWEMNAVAGILRHGIPTISVGADSYYPSSALPAP